MCDTCPLRGAYDKNKKSLLGRFWRWHINFCPGWSAYYKTLDLEARQKIKVEYDFER